MTIPSTDETQTYRVQYDWADPEPIGTTIINAIAALKDVEPTDLDSLYEYVDPDALENIFHPRPDGTPRRGGQVQVTVQGMNVIVHGSGEVVIESSA